MREALVPYRYRWPRETVAGLRGWTEIDGGRFHERRLPESAEELHGDSRWPAFFPSAQCLATTGNDRAPVLEKIVGASIVNRFPYVLAVSVCRERLSARHYVRREFMEELEACGTAAVQFLPPGEALDRAMGAIAADDGEGAGERLRRAGLPTRRAVTTTSPVFEDAYLVYEVRFARPGVDFEGRPVYERPWADVGSHRVYFLEITAIQLRQDIAAGHRQIRWRSLPVWTPSDGGTAAPTPADDASSGRYQKGYTPHYAFPSAGTIAFEADDVREGMAVKLLPSEPADQVEVDNDRARWPCFFPSSVGMITTWTPDGRPNLMPCGSTTVVSRQPLVITPCVSYAAVNERYAPRASLELIRKSGAFACGVPYIDDAIVHAIKYAGNNSLAVGPDKLARTGLRVAAGEWAPLLPDLPVSFECRVAGEIRLGTHVMFLGEVERIVVRADVTPANHLEWCPWADIARLDES